MAEFGAHLATVSTELPSVFEVLAQENLNSTLRPAFGHLIKVIAELDLGRFGFELLRWRNEIYTVLELFLQHYSLKTCGASFAERFYGLRRLPVGFKTGQKSTPGYKLPASHHWKSIFGLVIVPYLKLRVDAVFERSREDANNDSSTDRSGRKRLRRLFVFLYPLLHLSWELLVLYHQVLYALGREQQYPSPIYRFARTKLVTLSEDDDASNPLIDLWNELRLSESWMQLPRVLFEHVIGRYRELFTSLLSLGTFFLQFLEWWYTASQVSYVPVTMLAPPKFPQERTSLGAGLCPVCRRMRTNEAALSTSGYVFCYPCLYKQVKENGSCPVTGLPTDVTNIVRLYSDEMT